MKINERFSIERAPYNVNVIETILVNRDHRRAKGKNSARTIARHFTKLSQACEWVLNESIDLGPAGSVQDVLDSINQAKDEILAAIQRNEL